MNHKLNEFNSIRDAYGYGISCPICEVPIFTSLAKRYNWNCNSYNDLNMFLGGYEIHQNINVDTLGNNSKFVFNVHSGIIVEFSITKMNNVVYELGSCSTIMFNSNSPCSLLYYVGNGIMSFKHNVCCDNCAQYSYWLNLEANLNTKYMISSAYMASESVTITDNDNTIDIENDYVLQKTNYTILSNFDSKTQTLPLISNSLMKPYDVFNRIKNVLIFS